MTKSTFSIIKKYLSYLKFPLMIFLIWYLANSGKFEYKSFSGFFSDGGAVYFLVMLLMLLAVHLLFSKRYQLFIRAINFNPDFKTVFNVIMVGVFYNNFFPGGTGGDLIRIYYLKSHEGIPVATGAATTLMDRIIGLLGLAFVASLSLAGLTVFSSSSSIPEYKAVAAAAVSLPVAAVMVIICLRLNSVYNFVKRILIKLPLSTHSVPFLDTSRVLVSNTRLIVISFFLCVAGHIITLMCISFIAYMLFGAEAAKAAAAVSGIVLLSIVVPVTPGNIGWTEWLADKLFAVFGTEGGATVFVMWRLLSVTFSLFGGIIYLYMGKRKDSAIKEAVLGMEKKEK